MDRQSAVAVLENPGRTFGRVAVMPPGARVDLSNLVADYSDATNNNLAL